MAECVHRADPRHMKKRAFAALLWFYTFWYAGAMIASFLDVSPVFGPILGTAAAAIVAGDPRRMIWTRSRTTAQPNSLNGIPNAA